MFMSESLYLARHKAANPFNVGNVLGYPTLSNHDRTRRDAQAAGRKAARGAPLPADVLPRSAWADWFREGQAGYGRPPLSRLLHGMRLAGLSECEAACCIASFRRGDEWACEAVNVMGGTRETIRQAMRMRRDYARRLRQVAA